ncbi:MAG: endonuclease/exonuclease/phosphatase family protein [Deltaproteobacteria bacterium]|nr:endonuclease/exonuclease/phosphatase family protein [Deltaproteobacteria bacterium]
MRSLCLPALFILVLILPNFSHAGTDSTLTLCTWNLEHLAARNDTGCRPRKNADYLALREYADTLKADIIAFQEVENLTAARRVFDPSKYKIELSNRPDVDLGRCRGRKRDRRMQRTGFAIRKNRLHQQGVTVSRLKDVRSLACRPSERWGVHITLQFDTVTATCKSAAGKVLHLLCVHLKSGCTYRTVAYRNDDSPCSRLAVQVPRLAAWMDAQAGVGEDFIVLGDFNRQLDQLGDAVWKALDDSVICTWVRPASGMWHCRKGTARYNRIADIERARAGRKHPYPHYPRHPYAVDHIVMSVGADWMAIEKTAEFIRDDKNLSDHTPLVIKLDTSRGIPPPKIR